MKNINTTIILLSIIAVFSLNSFKDNKTTVPKQTDLKCFVSNDANLIKTIIDSWSKNGYKVISIIPQSVSTSINVNYFFNKNYENYRDVKGNIILVMEK